MKPNTIGIGLSIIISACAIALCIPHWFREFGPEVHEKPVKAGWERDGDSPHLSNPVYAAFDRCIRGQGCESAGTPRRARPAVQRIKIHRKEDGPVKLEGYQIVCAEGFKYIYYKHRGVRWRAFALTPVFGADRLPARCSEVAK